MVDLALDTDTGDIYFVGNRNSPSGAPSKRGLLGVIDTNDTATELYYVGTNTFTDMAIDPVHRWGNIFCNLFIIPRLDTMAAQHKHYPVNRIDVLSVRIIVKCVPNNSSHTFLFLCVLIAFKRTPSLQTSNQRITGSENAHLILAFVK